MREYLDGLNLVENAPCHSRSPSKTPTLGAKQAAIDFYGRGYKMISAAIFYRQYMAASLGKIYFVSPDVRLKPPTPYTPAVT